MLEDVRATSAHAWKAQVDPALEEVLHACAKHHALAAKRRARESTVAHPMPLVEQLMAKEQEVLSQLRDFEILILGERQELTEQVRPADLAHVHRPEPELRSSVANEDPAGGSEQLAQVVPAPVERDREDGDERGRNGPDRARAARQAPTGGVYMLHALLTRVLECLLDGRRQRIAQPLLGFAQRSERQADSQHLREQRHRLPSAQAIGARQQTDERDEARTAHPERHAGRELCARHVTALIASALVQPVLGHIRRHDREFSHLMAKRIRAGIRRQLVSTTITLRGKMVLGRRHLLGRQELTPVTLVARLAASPLPATLRLRALVPLLRRIG
jgi:hypothetical protein